MFFRVRTIIPLRVTPIDPADFERCATEVLSHIDPELPEVDPALIGWLDRIERKLDRVLAALRLADASAATDEWNRTTELSGSGLSFVPEQVFEPGSAVLLEFELPETPIRSVHAIGRVVEQEAGPEGEIGVAFEIIRQSDRDAVVGHTLAVQRQEILQGGRARDSTADALQGES